MYGGKFQVGDMGIDFKSNVDISPHKYFELTKQTTLQLNLFDADINQSVSDYGKLRVMSRDIHTHQFKRLMCHMLDLYSNKYSAIHASGVALKGKGVLFTGPSGHGKSTLAKIFPDSTTLDDDLLILTEDEMSISGKFGTTTLGEGDERYLKPLKGENVIKKHKLDLVFLLDKRFKGGYCNEVDNIISRRYSHLTLSHKLTQRQRLLKNPRVNAKVFVLGTNGELERTKGCIEEIVSS